ncbi:MAG: site-specific integrase [Actinomycetia bacterium]|nr:site-specific integrase [Actinomycetes bacterium]
MSVYDRWHKTHPKPDEPVCREHKRVPTLDHGQGERWQVRWRDHNGKQCKRNFERKAGADPERCADAFDAKVQAGLDAGTSIDHAAGKTKLKDYAGIWRRDLLHRDSTVERMATVFRIHIDPVLGHLPMAQVRSSHLRAWVKNRSEVLAPSTLAVAYSYIVTLFNSALIDRAIGLSPCLGVRLPDVEKHQHYIPTPDQVHTIAETLTPRYSAIGYLAAGCGLRGGEITGLEVDAIDFLRREVDVRQQLVCLTGRRPFLAPTKTKTSVRTVELPEVTGAALAWHLKNYPPIEIEIDDHTDPRNPRRRMAKLVFLGRTKRPISRSDWAHIWAPARDAAGIPNGIGLHCLRHYFATLLIHNGASVKTVQMALGHATPTITLNTYVGEWPEPHEKTRSIVDSALGSVPRLCPEKTAEK